MVPDQDMYCGPQTNVHNDGDHKQSTYAYDENLPDTERAPAVCITSSPATPRLLSQAEVGAEVVEGGAAVGSERVRSSWAATAAT